MSSQFTISAEEHGVVRLFASEQEMSLDALTHALGGVALDADHVDLIALDDLDEIGLIGYLSAGMGLPESELAPMRPQLGALKGHAILLRSAAFTARPVTFTARAPLRWIARFQEPSLNMSAPPLRSEAAKGQITAAAPDASAGHGRVLTFILLALAGIVAATCAMLYFATR